jgi:hypothetical protein
VFFDEGLYEEEVTPEQQTAEIESDWQKHQATIKKLEVLEREEKEYDSIIDQYQQELANNKISLHDFQEKYRENMDYLIKIRAKKVKCKAELLENVKKLIVCGKLTK